MIEKGLERRPRDILVRKRPDGKRPGYGRWDDPGMSPGTSHDHGGSDGNDYQHEMSYSPPPAPVDYASLDNEEQAAVDRGEPTAQMTPTERNEQGYGPGGTDNPDYKLKQFEETGDIDELADFTGIDTSVKTDIADIHGEWDDPDSKSYDPTYNPVTQAKATKKSAFGSGKHSGAYIWDSKNQEYFRVQDYTWKEHYDRAPDIIKWSPTLRSIYATGKNIGEWAARKGWTYDSKTGTVNDGQGNNVGERDLMNAASTDAPYVASGTPIKSAPDSMAAKWFNQLGGSAGNFNLTSAFADAKAKQQQILGNTTPVGLLAAGNTPYFDFLQKHSLTKGIL